MTKRGLQINVEEELKDTDITAAELEELSDGSETTLHSHAASSVTAADVLAATLIGMYM